VRDGLQPHELLTMSELSLLHQHYPGWLSILHNTSNESPARADKTRPDEIFIMSGRLCKTETYVKQHLALLSQREPPWFGPNRRPPRLPSIKHSQLSSAQATSVQSLLSHSLAVLTGGPGVGKTYLIRALTQCLDAE
jgi:hypothetical protein